MDRVSENGFAMMVHTHAPGEWEQGKQKRKGEKKGGGWGGEGREPKYLACFHAQVTLFECSDILTVLRLLLLSHQTSCMLWLQNHFDFGPDSPCRTRYVRTFFLTTVVISAEF